MSMTTKQDTAANALPYRAAWGAFWQNVTALQQIVTEEFPDGDDEGIAPTRYQVDALRDLGGRIGALVEGYTTPPPF